MKIVKGNNMKKLLSLMLLIGQVASAATPVVVFNYSVNSQYSPVTPTLTWSSNAVSSCKASSSPYDSKWTGVVPLSGSKAVGPISVNTSYTLTCYAASDTTATLSWTAPYLNTDGSQLTNLAGFKAYEVMSTGPVLTSTINGPQYTSLPVVNLAIGTHTFYVTAFNTTGVESAPSNTGSKTIVAATSASKTVSVPVKKKR